MKSLNTITKCSWGTNVPFTILLIDNIETPSYNVAKVSTMNIY